MKRCLLKLLDREEQPFGCPGVDADKQDADTVERVERLRSVPSGGQSSRFPSTLIVHVIWVLVHACM